MTARRFCIALVVLTLAAPGHAAAQGADEIVLLPYPDRIEALKAPVNVAMRYRQAAPRSFVTDIIWGPEKAPGLYRLNAQGTVEINAGKDGPVVTLKRDATQFTFGPKVQAKRDAGTIKAEITPSGGFRRIELDLPELDTKAHRAQFALLGTGLIDTGRVPPFERLQTRAGPDDSGGGTQLKREKDARIEILEAMQPLLGFVLDNGEGGVHTGSRMTVLRRDLGDLFRDAGPIPLRVEGRVMGLSEYDDRRFLVLKLDRAEMAPPMRAIVDGYALIDIDTALPETVVATIELVILQGTDTTVFRFVERRALIPDPEKTQ
ncbi:MAG: hypothetical protein JJ900_10800 [Rhodospirillales bacterium]|nr:hypothetical protein [Rhodospirillales bacterium]MBO6787328.1 hypothetical protein [Rhodospirillales bacterium]